MEIHFSLSPSLFIPLPSKLAGATSLLVPERLWHLYAYNGFLPLYKHAHISKYGHTKSARACVCAECLCIHVYMFKCVSLHLCCNLWLIHSWQSAFKRVGQLINSEKPLLFKHKESSQVKSTEPQLTLRERETETEGELERGRGEVKRECGKKQK